MYQIVVNFALTPNVPSQPSSQRKPGTGVMLPVQTPIKIHNLINFKMLFWLLVGTRDFGRCKCGGMW
eukprot:scaffold267400_cov17-Tisochrysis_lutea.AAC.1